MQGCKDHGKNIFVKYVSHALIIVGKLNKGLFSSLFIWFNSVLSSLVQFSVILYRLKYLSIILLYLPLVPDILLQIPKSSSSLFCPLARQISGGKNKTKRCGSLKKKSKGFTQKGSVTISKWLLYYLTNIFQNIAFILPIFRCNWEGTFVEA